MGASHYWQVLGLDAPTHDKKAIKKAYARQLKLHRPDEDPEGFQRLRKAYEFALAFVEQPETEAPAELEWRELQDVLSENDRVEFNLLDGDAFSESSSELAIVNDDQDITEADIKEDDLLQDVEKEILIRVKALLETPAAANNPKNWSFISDYPELFNPIFNWMLGVKVFASLNTLIPKHFILKEGVALPINLEIILYLDGLFNWQNQTYELGQELDSEEFNVLFRILAFSGEYAQFNRGHGVKGGTVVGDPEAQQSIQSVGSAFYVMAGLVAVVLVLAMMVVD